jgi:Mn-dependent DtxR family transcriptional regulator
MRPEKIYTDILEQITHSTEEETTKDFSILNLTPTQSNTDAKKKICAILNVSLSTYNKYLRELKNGTYVRCERENFNTFDIK